jgi:hypothetical protein
VRLYDDAPVDLFLTGESSGLPFSAGVAGVWFKDGDECPHIINAFGLPVGL